MSQQLKPDMLEQHIISRHMFNTPSRLNACVRVAPADLPESDTCMPMKKAKRARSHLSNTTCLTQLFFNSAECVATYGDNWHYKQRIKQRRPYLSSSVRQVVPHKRRLYTPSPPTKSFPTKSPRVKLSGRLPIEFNRHENSHPLELRVCLNQTLRNPNS